MCFQLDVFKITTRFDDAFVEAQKLVAKYSIEALTTEPYGVLKGRIIGFERKASLRGGAAPYFEILVSTLTEEGDDDEGTSPSVTFYRVAINVTPTGGDAVLGKLKIFDQYANMTRRKIEFHKTRIVCQHAESCYAHLRC